jgi:hypothetical protein
VIGSLAVTTGGAPVIAGVGVSSVVSAVYWDDAQRAGGSTGNDRGRSLAVAADGTVLVTGNFEGTAYFPTSADESIALTSLGGTDVFVAALNKDDSYFAWAQRAGGTESGFGLDQGNSVAVAADGTVLVTGYFRDTAYFPTSAEDSIALTSNGANSEVFVAALNKGDSYFAWAQRAGGTNNDVGNSVAVATDGTVLVTGSFQDTATFPTSAEDSIALTSAGVSDVFVAALNKDDSYFAWAQRAGAGGTNSDVGNSVAVAADGTVLVTGSFRGTAYFPAGALADDSIALTSNGNGDVFVAALNKDDSYFAWAQRAGGNNDDRGSSVAVAADGTVLVTGSFQSTAYFPTSAEDSIALTSGLTTDTVFVAALNEDDSYFAWAQRAGGTLDSQGKSVAVAADGTVLVTGDFEGTAYFPTSAEDSIALTSFGELNVFVAALNKDDSYFAWAQRAGPPADSASASAIGNSVAVARDGTVLVTGSSDATAYFPTSAEDSIALTSAGGSDMFVGWLLTPLVPPVPPAPAVPAGAPTGVSGEAGDGQVLVSWAAPASSGSFPVSTYQAVVSPSGQSCLVAVPALTCTISGLTNGASYTATVRALTGAGWGAYSAVSNAFTPRSPVVSSITISGTRTEVRGKPGVIVTGTTTGFGMGAILRPWIRFPGQTSYTQGSARILVDVQGGITWERRTGKTIYISIMSEDATVKSNRLILRRT